MVGGTLGTTRLRFTAAAVPAPGMLGQFKAKLVGIHLANLSSTNQTFLQSQSARLMLKAHVYLGLTTPTGPALTPGL